MLLGLWRWDWIQSQTLFSRLKSFWSSVEAIWDGLFLQVFLWSGYRLGFHLLLILEFVSDVV